VTVQVVQFEDGTTQHQFHEAPEEGPEENWWPFGASSTITHLTWGNWDGNIPFRKEPWVVLFYNPKMMKTEEDCAVHNIAHFKIILNQKVHF